MSKHICHRCETEMEKGQFIRNGFGIGIGLSWLRETELKNWGGSSNPLRTYQYRCTDCGVIETYTDPDD